MSRLTAESRRDRRFNREFRRIRRKQERGPKIDITDDIAHFLPARVTPLRLGEFPCTVRPTWKDRTKVLLNSLFGRFARKAG